MYRLVHTSVIIIYEIDYVIMYSMLLHNGLNRVVFIH